MSLTETSAARTRPIPKSIVARALQGVRYAITGVTPESWFGPSQPLAPMAPAEVAGRRFDYPTGYNLQYGPRAYEPVSFADLRALADNCDILRLVIETRKDQIEAQDWDIRPKKAADGTRPKASAFANDIAAAKAFLAFPDREHDFAQWARQIAEDMFVIDAASLYKRRDRKGRACAFEIIDGTTIAPRIDQWGRTPAPPDVAYQQILHGVPAADYASDGLAAMTSDELIYYPRNKRPGHVYGQSPVEQIILTANIVMRRSLHQLAYYTDGNLTDAIFTAPTGWTADQIKVWQDFWDSQFAGNLRERRHGTWVPQGTAYVPLKDIVLKDAFDEYLARLVCFCFSISPQAFVSQVNRATAETAKAQAAEEGLAPVLNWFKRLLDLILQRHLGYDALEFVWIDDREMDPSAADAIDVADVKAGIRTINEVRMSRGLDPLPGGDKLMIATGTGYVPVGEGAPAAQAAPASQGFAHRVSARDLQKDWEPDDHPRWPAGSDDSVGGRFSPKGHGGATDGATAGENTGRDVPSEEDRDRGVNAVFDASLQNGRDEATLDNGAYHPGEDDAEAATVADDTADNDTENHKQVREHIADVARQFLGSKAYLKDISVDGFPAGKVKCNKFVSDMIVDAGIAPPLVPRYGPSETKNWLEGPRPPTAGEWADPAAQIPGWIVLPRDQAQPGDVIAEAHKESDGHVGVVVGPQQTASASNLTTPKGIIVINDWGFRAPGRDPEGNGEDGPDQVSVVRRYMGY